jgi:hypothetical protein
MLTSQCSAHDNEDSNSEKGDEDRPLHPDRFTLVYEQLREQVYDGDAQSIDGMEQRAEENKDLKDPVLVNGVDENAALATQE